MKKSKFTWYVYDKNTGKTIVDGLKTSEEAHEKIRELEKTDNKTRFKLSCRLVD